MNLEQLKAEWKRRENRQVETVDEPPEMEANEEDEEDDDDDDEDDEDMTMTKCSLKTMTTTSMILFRRNSERRHEGTNKRRPERTNVKHKQKATIQVLVLHCGRQRYQHQQQQQLPPWSFAKKRAKA
jgi:hypothetical protein